jgi:hypothetical protein
MRVLLPALGLAAAATALPSQPQARAADAAKASKSKGFYLAAKVTEHDLTPPIDGWLLSTAHTGAGFNAAVFYGASADQARLFYQNGTAWQAAHRQTTIVTDGGTPLAPSSLIVGAAGQPPQIASINYQEGTPNTVVSLGADGKQQPQLVNALGGGAWLACNATIPYYGYNFITLQYAYAEAAGSASGGNEVPDSCVPITLVPRCATLNDVPTGSYSSHEFADEVSCVVSK